MHRGAVKRKVNEIFGHTLRESEKKEICTLIYYPEEKLQLIKEQETDLDDWYLITLNQLVKSMPERFVQIYPFESTQGTSSRVLVYHSRAVARIEHRT